MRSMMYVKKGEEGMSTYFIEYDTEVLDTFRVNAILDLSKVIHYDYESPKSPFVRKKPLDPLEIQNYHKTFIRKENKTPVYRHEYDYYEFPYIVKLIDRIERGDGKAIEEIINPDFSKERIPILEEITNKKNQLLELKNNNPEQQKELLTEIKKLLIDYQNGNYEIPSLEYYEQLKEILNFRVENLDLKENLKK